MYFRVIMLFLVSNTCSYRFFTTCLWKKVLQMVEVESDPSPVYSWSFWQIMAGIYWVGNCFEKHTLHLITTSEESCRNYTLYFIEIFWCSVVSCGNEFHNLIVYCVENHFKHCFLLWLLICSLIIALKISQFLYC